MKQAHLYKRKRSRSTNALIVTALVSACMIAAFIFALNVSNRRIDGAETALLETALRRACVTCYAVEGRYPPNLDYITDRYGVLIDTHAFSVRYDAFAENLLPDIQVVRRKGVGE